MKKARLIIALIALAAVVLCVVLPQIPAAAEPKAIKAEESKIVTEEESEVPAVTEDGLTWVSKYPAKGPGLAKASDGKWYYLYDGTPDPTYNGIVSRMGAYHYIKNGLWDRKYNGLFKQDGVKYLFKKGKCDLSFTGWYKNGKKRYYIENGKAVTGWKKIDGSKYYFKKTGNMAKETVKVDGRLEVFRTSGKFIKTTSMDKKAAKLSSDTNWLILVDLNKRVTKVYKGSKGNWTVVKNILSTVGDTRVGNDTVKGTFYVGYSNWGNAVSRGYSFEDSDGHTLYYWTRFCNAYLFHSQLYERGTKTLTKAANGLGQELSHGCVRMRIKNAKWIYDNIPDGTKVVVY